jgi:hypothetical protein
VRGERRVPGRVLRRFRRVSESVQGDCRAPGCRTHHEALPAPDRPGPARFHHGIGGPPHQVATRLQRGADTILRNLFRRGPARGVTAVGTRCQRIEHEQGRGDPREFMSIRPAREFRGAIAFLRWGRRDMIDRSVSECGWPDDLEGRPGTTRDPNPTLPRRGLIPYTCKNTK